VDYVDGVSKTRAKKKRRQRTRAASAAPAGGSAARASPSGGESAAETASGGGAKRRAAGGGESAGQASRDRGADGRAAEAKRGDEEPSGAASRGGVQRPRPVWAPFPLTEIGMAAGIIIFGSGFESNSSRTLSIGALVLAVVVGELCLREHFAGFRSHTLLLAALPVAVAHGVVALAITDAYRGPPTLAVDLAIGCALAWWLRARYREANARARPA
jgi:hypothetical protein